MPDDEAVKEQKDAKPAEAQPKPDTSAPGSQAQPSGDAKTAEKTVPFHENPEVKSYLERQFKSRERKLREEYDGRLKDIEGRYVSQLEQMTRGRTQENGIPEDQEEALVRLAGLFKQSPSAMKALGLDQFDALKKQNETLSTSMAKEAFEKEKSEVLAIAKEKYGLDASIVEEELAEYISSNPYYDKDYTKGLYRAAFRDRYFDQMDELKERAANLKQIKEQKEKEAAGSQGSSTSKKEAKPAYASITEMVKGEGAKHGGISFGS